MGSLKGFLHRKMNIFSGYFWVFLSYLMQTLFGVFTRIFMRYYSPSAINSACLKFSQEIYQTDSNFTKQKTEANFSDQKAKHMASYSKCSEDTELESESFESGVTGISSHESNQIDSNGSGPEAEPKLDCSETVNDIENVGLDEEESPKLVFKFQYQTWKYSEKSDESHTESYDFAIRDRASATTNKYEFMSGTSFSQFLEKPQVSNFIVEELYVHSNKGSLENKEINDSGILSERDFMPENRGGGAVNVEIPDNSTEKVDKKKVAEKLKTVLPSEPPDSGKEQLENPNSNMLSAEISAADDFLPRNDFVLSSESHSISSNLDYLFESQLRGDGSLSDTDFETSIELDTLRNHDAENAGLTEEDFDMEEQKNSENLDVGYEPDDYDEDDRYVLEELRRLEEESQLLNSDMANMENLKGDSFQGSINSKPQGFGNREKRSIDCSDESAKPNLQISTASDLDDSNRFDTLWEHQDLIEQLKMELKKVRATGLPTILEDSESPRIMEDLKPWKIDEKFHGSGINELPKFYRSYRERMRKFDILNYQKMYAIGVLQSKDPLQSFSSRKASVPAITSLLSQRFRLCRRKKSELDPMKKFIRELYSDLEMVYVGQLCLSWEFLQWEYEKALQLWESDQYGSRRYNEVAGEFQQFQVLLQRFIENEPFQGPRVENYVKNRCLMRNLLQVPVIREDNAKDKKKLRKRGTDKDAITSDMLVEILEESIRTIWRFIRADKEASSLTLKGLREAQVELLDTADSELLVEVRAELQKKEKRLRDVLRSGSCILKKFQKQHQEDETDQFLYFFSQVDTKLVWRVLNMSRITTDQLAWCRNKLNKISFVNRRIHVEPSFLLFPC